MLTELLGSRLRARILGWLFTHPDERYFVRQLASLLAEDSTNLSRELARLAKLGIVTCRTEGRQKYYQADPDCPVYQELQGLAAKTAGLGDVLRQLLEPLAEKIDAAFVYGSQAAGEPTAGSDVDVLVIGTLSFTELAAALAPAHDKLGREVNPTVYPPSEFRKKLRQRHHFLKTVTAGPKIFLIGDDHELAGLA